MNVHALPEAGSNCSVQIVVEEPARDVVAQLGRTEDIRFSPDNRRLAIAGYRKNSCFLFDIDIQHADGRPVVRILDYVEIRSDQIRDPHGFDFIDNETLVVANRGGKVTVFAIPEGRAGSRLHTLSPLRKLKRLGLRDKIRSPGSVCVLPAKRGYASILVCNNYVHRVTSHRFAPRGLLPLARSKVLLENGLAIPDGIAVTQDGAWIAVSNHKTHCVAVYDNRARLDPTSAPVGLLHGVDYPHGLRFSGDGKRLYVADAGRPLVVMFESDDGSWEGTRDARAAAKVLDDDTFQRGRTNPEEGGPKGLDVDRSQTILAVTCEEQALAFYHLPSLFPRS